MVLILLTIYCQQYFLYLIFGKIVFEIDEDRIFTVDDYINECQDMILKYNISFNIFSNKNIVLNVKTEKVYYYNRKA